MKMFIFKFRQLLSPAMVLFPVMLSAQVTDLTKAEILASPGIPSPVRETVIRVLQEEVAKRTSVNLRLTTKPGKTPLLVLAACSDKEIYGITVPKSTGSFPPEIKQKDTQYYQTIAPAEIFYG